MSRSTRLRFWLLAASFVSALLFWGKNGYAQFAPPGVFGANATGDVNNIFPLAPRELRQRLSRAQAALDEERYSDAVAEIGEVLNSAGSDDFFLGMPGSADAQVSLKTQAMSLLGDMPAKGRRMYELQFGADAKAALEASLTAGDLAQLTEVSRRYFQTKAGYEATLLLGRYQLDQGRPLAAALTLKRIADVPTAAAQYDPELSVLLATCWLHANQPQEAKETLLALKKRQPQAKVKLLDREAKLFDRDTAALDWLQDIVGGSRSALSAAATQWVMYRGDEKRNAQSSGGLPLLNFNWKVPTVNDPNDEQRVAKKYRDIRDADGALVPILQPLVVQDYVVVRQPETSKLIGISLAHNGKREWVYPANDDNSPRQVAQQAMQTNRNPTTNQRELELKERIWDDNVFGQVSSDGRQVYVIDDLSYANVNQQPVIIGGRGRAFQNPGVTKQHNLLVALDLVKQGYSVWAVGGATGDDNPALAGAFFLGPPLPVGDQLYALAEFTGEIRLVCLNSRTGDLEWKQPLANIEERTVQYDITRRLSGASPSLADGILVCPTSAGAVVAIDLATRTLRWGYQYSRDDVAQMMQPGGFRRPAMPMMNQNTGGSWLDSTATIADGCVILTPPESKRLHCLDLLTGKARWSPLPRGDMLFVACVHKGKIILVGKNKLSAINLSDGKSAWTSDLKLDGETAVGRGYYSGSHYYLPVSGQQICKIDLDGGKIDGRTQTELELGNLVCYKDQLISVSPQSVSSFVLLSEHLQQQLGERLAANPQDIDALALKAQILLQEGDAKESLALLRRAAELAPERGMVKTLLVKVMLALVRQDFATHAALTDELDKLVTDAATRREVLRYRVQGLAESDRVWDAFGSLIELADQELSAAAGGAPQTALQPIERERNARTDRWLARQLQKLLDKADSPTRERIEEELKTRLAKALTIDSVHQLRMFISLFGFHEVSDAARVALIDRLIAADAMVEAEVIAGDLVARQDTAAAAAWLTLAGLYEKAKRPELAARAYQRIAADFAQLTMRGGQTGAALLAEAKQNAALKPFFATWPAGAVEVKESEANGLAQRTSMPVAISHYGGTAPRGMKVSYDTSSQAISVRSDTGQLIASASIRNDRSNVNRPMFFAGNNPATAKVNGHLVVVHMGSEILAVDGLRSDRGAESLLWRQETGDDANGAVSLRAPTRPNRNPLAGNRQMVVEGTRGSYSIGPVTSGGVCFQRGRQLICLDALTGASLWERSSTPQAEIPQQADLFGDGELLFVADARLDSKSEELLVLSAIDGSLLGKRKVEPTERRWAAHGRHVLAWEDKSSVVKLRLYDAWNDRELWSRPLAKGSKGCLIDGEELAIFELSGQFSVVSLESGKVQFSIPLLAESSLAWIHVFRSASEYLLLASQTSGPAASGGLSALQAYGGTQQQSMNGRVYAFARSTGKLQWQTPAVVKQHWLPPDQPSESPVLFFVANRQANNKVTTAVLVLDRRTGREVYANELPGIASTADIVVDPVKQNASLALIGNGHRSVTFHFTDKPLPPQPPARSGETADSSQSRKLGAGGLSAAIDNLVRRGPEGLFVPDAEAPAGANPAGTMR